MFVRIRRCWIVPIVCWSLVTLVWPFRSALAHEASHTVQAGETLSEIAQRYATDVATLRRLNNLDDADFVWAGQQLDLPEDATPSPPPAETTASATVEAQASAAEASEPKREAPAGTREHIVQPGEHLGTIAARYDVAAQAISEANQLADPSLLVPGQRLVIPELAVSQSREMAARSTEVDTETESVTAYHVHRDFSTETEKWIDVDLSEQHVVAYEGTVPVKAFIISSGLPGTPTVTGTYRIWAKVALQDMYGGNRAAGDYYYLEDVPWVQYFFEDYAFHGTYWHDNFGQPMSRGCINMRNEDAQWLFDWADPVADGDAWTFSGETQPGTLVLVHE